MKFLFSKGHKINFGKKHPVNCLHCKNVRNQIPWNKGKRGIFSKETLEKMRLAKKGKKQLPEVIAKRILSNKGQKRSEATKKKMSLIKIGEKNPMFGKKPARWKGEKPKCQDCNTTLNSHKAKRCVICNNRFSYSKEKSPFWKGGITPLVLQIRHCFKYRQWRSDIFTRDDFTCQKCKKRGEKLEADHFPEKFSFIFHRNRIKSIEQALECEEFWNINNGRTLCKKCHRSGDTFFESSD